MVNTDTKTVLEIKDIRKSFHDNLVLRGISFAVKEGEILGLLGSNGAGKSTLMKIINGVYTKDSGHIFIRGEEVHFKDAKGARENGIAMVYQEFSIIPTMTAAQNLFLGVEKKKGGFLDDKAMRKQAKQAFEDFGISIDPDAEMSRLSIGEQQLVEIVKALQKNPSVLILDEPTASLASTEIQLLFDFIRRLKQKGLAIFFISHHMQEIMDICDRAVILRDGEVELDAPVSELSISKMVQAMIGKTVDYAYLQPKANVVQTEVPLLSVKNLNSQNAVNGVSFDLQAGEVLGIAGLMGSGRTEILESIFGIRKISSGQIQLNGVDLENCTVQERIKRGVFLVPEDRRRCSIVGIHSIAYNMMMAVWKNMRKSIFIHEKTVKESAEDMRKHLDIKSSSIDQEIQDLSGGNQQKVVFAKSLLSKPSVLLLDEPTIGIDVEAKASIAKLVRTFADEGKGVIMVASETEELLRLCDRVLIFKKGKLIQTFIRGKDEMNEALIEQAVQM